MMDSFIKSNKIIQNYNEVFTIFFIWLITLFLAGMIIWFSIEQWRSRSPNRGIWLADTAAKILFFAMLFLIGRWDIYGYYLRFIIPVLFLLIVVKSYFQVKHLPWRLSKTNAIEKFTIGVHFMVAVIFSSFLFSALKGYYYPAHAINLSSPFKNGTYYVVHGGNSTQINYHNSHLSQAYALDIEKLNRIGTRASGITPEELNQYEIYGETIYSPCAGKIINVVDGVKELAPNQMNDQTKNYRTKNPEGNSVIIQCKSAEVHIAHMIPRSIKVKQGQQIRDGMVIGKVGNSGNTSEPHLHIHAEKKGKGIPVLFDGRFLKRNNLF